MREYLKLFCFGLFAFIVGCSSTTSAVEDDEAFENSSDSKQSSSSKNTSSSSGENSPESSNSEELGEDCVGKSGVAWDGTTAKDFACGSGTKLSPHIILTAEQLAHLSFEIGANNKDYQGKYYKLGADIILNEGKIIDEKGALSADSSKLHKWTPIGNSSVEFTGNFDGDGHSVSGMFINTTSTHNGLFGNVSGTVQNLVVENGWVMGGKFTAGVVGYNVGTISGVENYASATATDACVGGVVGSSNEKQYRYNSVIKNVKNYGIIVGKNNVGGVAGCATYVTIDGATNEVAIEGYAYVGGVLGGIGSTNDNDIKNLWNKGKISGSHFVGGVAGHCGGALHVYESNNSSSYYCNNSAYHCGKVSNAYNENFVSGKNYVGGAMGEACGANIMNFVNVADVEGEYGVGGVIGSVVDSKTKSLYNTGNVFGSEYVGGIFSYNKEGVTSSAYSTGKVDGDTLVGLMIGYNFNTTMADYYYLEQGEQEPFGLNNGGGVATPKSEKEMKSAEFAELLGEDFAYDSGLNSGYPVLNWEIDQ